VWSQGDQIGRIFAICSILYSILCNFASTFSQKIKIDRDGTKLHTFWAILGGHWAILSQKHPVTLSVDAVVCEKIKLTKAIVIRKPEEIIIALRQ
jgi:hypothetical protein